MFFLQDLMLPFLQSFPQPQPFLPFQFTETLPVFALITGQWSTHTGTFSLQLMGYMWHSYGFGSTQNCKFT